MLVVQSLSNYRRIHAAIALCAQYHVNLHWGTPSKPPSFYERLARDQGVEVIIYDRHEIPLEIYFHATKILLLFPEDKNLFDHIPGIQYKVIALSRFVSNFVSPRIKYLENH